MIGFCDNGNQSHRVGNLFFLDLYPLGYNVISFMRIFLMLSYMGNITASKVLWFLSVCTNFISAWGDRSVVRIVTWLRC